MNYELAKQLHDAGFEKKSGAPIFIEDDFFPPTLSELVEACGERFRWLGLGLPNNKFNPKWCAQARGITLGDSVRTKDIKISGCDTQEEAVAYLWLALNKK